jgi:hypothetical protein
MADDLSLSDVARELGVPPKFLADLFYRGRLDAGRCGTFAGRKVIPRSYVTEIRRVLAELGKLPEAERVGA